VTNGDLQTPPQILGTRFLHYKVGVFCLEKHGFDQVYLRKSRKTKKQPQPFYSANFVFQTDLLRRGSAQKNVWDFREKTCFCPKTQKFFKAFLLENTLFTFYCKTLIPLAQLFLLYVLCVVFSFSSGYPS
jgi:hypothetical protein